MKASFLKVLCSFAAFLIVLTACASAKSIPQCLDEFVDDAELNSESYTSEDWEKSQTEFEELLSEYENSNKKYTTAEKKLVAKAIGRYHALLLKAGLHESASLMKELGNVLPGYFEGLLNSLKGGASELNSVISSIMDSINVEQSLNDLESTLEGIFGK